MQLSKIFKDLKKNHKKHFFSNICSNSRDCKINDIFFSIKGKKFNGNLFINEAIKRGAKTIVSDKKYQGYKKDVLFIQKKNPRLALALACAKFYNLKPKNLLSVTGTNGKSSVADFYKQILNLNKIRCASIGTLGVKGNFINIRTKNTTLDSISLNRILYKLSKQRIENVILEASSHGLHQNRLDGIKFDLGIFTNLSRDHLDYHKSYKNYLNSKLILFKKLIKKKGIVVFDNSIKEASILKKIIHKNKLKSFNIGQKSDIQIIEHDYINNKQLVYFIFNKKKYFFKTRLIGKIQIKNLLMAIIAASRLISIEKIVKSVSKIKSVNGRFESIGKLKNGSRVILDYSHTPDALKMCLSNIKEQFKFSRLSIVFGCGGDRDKPKRQIMGKIVNKLCNKIYLTDDNPRGENPAKIRKKIKSKIDKNKLIEIPSRSQAIETAINNLKSNDVLIVAGKGHENYQEYKTKKFFSDKVYIKNSIINKNKYQSYFWKTNIFNENLKKEKLKKNIELTGVSTNSKKIKKNQIFIALKGKKYDGNEFAVEAVKNGALLSIVDNKSITNKKIINVNNTIKFFSKISSAVRMSSNANTIAITGSAGKTSFKELLGSTLAKMYPTIYSKASLNNKFGVPISMFKIKKKTKFAVFEVGMDKKGEIKQLSKLISPDVGVITNISYAHIKNFKNLKQIAKAKSEIIDEINENGKIILNKDDKFFNYLKKKAIKKKLKVISYSVVRDANFNLFKILKNKNNYFLIIKNGKKKFRFKIKYNLKPYISNLLGVMAVISIYFDLSKLNQDIFYNFKIPDRRGNLVKIKLNNKIINLIDESYNSNPMSLNFSIEKLNNIKIDKRKKKNILLSDMLELGKFSKKLHLDAAKIINESKVDKVFVYGKYINYTYNKIQPQKKGKKFLNRENIVNFLANKLKNGDYLMIKGSNGTRIGDIVNKLKNFKNVI